MKKKILSLFLCLATVSTLTACKTNVLQNDNALTEPATDTLVTTPVQSDAVNTVCYDTLTEGTKAIYNNLLAGFQNFDEQIVVEGNEADIERAYKNVIADHPEIFYISGLVYKDASNIVSHDRFTVFPSYSETKDSYEDYLKQADAVATEYLAAIETDNKYQIAKSLFRVVAENTSYVKDATHNQDMLSVFLFNQSVCGGYCQGYASKSWHSLHNTCWKSK